MNALNDTQIAVLRQHLNPAQIEMVQAKLTSKRWCVTLKGSVTITGFPDQDVYEAVFEAAEKNLPTHVGSLQVDRIELNDVDDIQIDYFVEHTFYVDAPDRLAAERAALEMAKPYMTAPQVTRAALRDEVAA